jgi:hypothetical protein
MKVREVASPAALERPNGVQALDLEHHVGAEDLAQGVASELRHIEEDRIDDRPRLFDSLERNGG